MSKHNIGDLVMITYDDYDHSTNSTQKINRLGIIKSISDTKPSVDLYHVEWVNNREGSRNISYYSSSEINNLKKQLGIYMGKLEKDRL